MNKITSEWENSIIDIAVVAETKKKRVGSENLGYYDHFYSGVSKNLRAQQGVTIIIRKSL